MSKKLIGNVVIENLTHEEGFFNPKYDKKRAFIDNYATRYTQKTATTTIQLVGSTETTSLNTADMKTLANHLLKTVVANGKAVEKSKTTRKNAVQTAKKARAAHVAEKKKAKKPKKKK